MANEARGIGIGVIPAGADLRLQQYRFVSIDATGRWVLATATARAQGILQNAPNTGEPADVLPVSGGGLSKLIVNAGAAIAEGAAVTVGAAAGGATAAATNHISARRADAPGDTGAAGTLCTVLLGYEGPA